MKHFKSLKNWVLMGMVALFAAGCAKDIDPGPAQPVSTLAVYHVSPDAPKLSFKLNNSVLNTDSIPYGTYGYYFNAFAGTREIAAYQKEVKKALLSLDLKEGSIYSAWLTGRWSAPEFVLIEDKLVNPLADKALIRFVNMSVDAPSLDLVTSTGTTIASNKAYKTASDFIEINGNQDYTFVIRQNGTTTDKFTLASKTIRTGNIYTIAARGFYNGAAGSTALIADFLTNLDRYNR